MASKKLPVGTTVYYIQQLYSLENGAIPTLREIEKNYSVLTFDNNANQPGSKDKLLIALIFAAGTFKKEGWIFRKEIVSDFNKSALKLLKDLVLIDQTLWNILKKRYNDFALAQLHLDKHVLQETPDVLEFIQFLTLTTQYSNYVQYVIDPEARKIVTDFLTKRKLEDNNASPARAEPALLNNNKKRTRGDDEKSDNEEDSPLRKRRKTESAASTTNNNNNNNTTAMANAEWYWCGDSTKSSQQDTWILYDEELSHKIEKAYARKQKTMKLDDERYVDFEHMLQRRYDDTAKRRAIKREVPALSNGQAELALGEGASN